MTESMMNSDTLLEAGILILKSLLVIAVAILAIKISSFLIKKAMNVRNDVMSKRKIKTLTAVFCNFAKYGILFFAASHIISLFGGNMASILAVAGIGSVAIGFGAQSFVKDLITGLFIIAEDHFGIDDVVMIGSLKGTVETIGLRTIRIRSFDGSLHIIPNSNISTITNCSKEFNEAIVDFAISNEYSIDKVVQVINDDFKKISIEGIKEDCEPKLLGITALTNRLVNMRIYAECCSGEKYNVEREIRSQLQQSLNNAGIAIISQKHINNNLEDSNENK